MPDVHSNPIADLILSALWRENWTLTGRARFGDQPLVISRFAGARTEADKAFMAKVFGADHMPDPVSGFLQALVRDGVRLNRVQYLRRLQALDISAGMASHDTPFATLQTTWSPGFGADTLKVSGGYVRPMVTFHDEGTVLLACEHVGQPGDDTVYDLYVWRGCDHEYEHSLLGRCYHGYTCKHCRHHYTIDSGD